MNRRHFLLLAGSPSLIYIRVAPALAMLPSEPDQAPVRRSYPDDQIVEILNQDAGTGSFSKTVTRPDGLVSTYSFSWAVGTGSLHYRANYRKYFAEDEPSWALSEHPFHQFRLFKQSVAANLPLPDRYPNFPRSAA